jgi:adenylate kinase family enzyme
MIHAGRGASEGIRSMRRVLVLGPGGAGKSHLAKAIAEAHGLPLIHLDEHYWSEGWTARPEAEWRSLVGDLLEGPEWVMDGNYGGTLDLRIPAADTVIVLDRPRWLCLWRLVRRRVEFHGRSRESLPDGCPERLTLSFLRWVWTYRRLRLPRVLQRLAALSRDKDVIVLRTRREVKDFHATRLRGATDGT